MKTITFSEFQPNCATILEALCHSQQSLLINQPGQWMVKIIPFSRSDSPHWLGCLSGTGQILGDIVPPPEEGDTPWEVLIK